MEIKVQRALSKEEMQIALEYLEQHSLFPSISSLINHLKCRLEEIEEFEKEADLEYEQQHTYTDCYFKLVEEKYFKLIHITDTIIESGKDIVYVYDELRVIDYSQVSFSTGVQLQKMFLFDEPWEETTEQEWIKELCYYFKRVPGNDEICCP